MLGSAVVLQGIRESTPPSRHAASCSPELLSLAPAALALRGGELAAYHGAEHISIGTLRARRGAPKEHERCGSHLVGPLLADDGRRQHPRRAACPQRHRPAAKLAATVGALAASTEIFGWMTRHPTHPLARALAKPGHELQHRLGTREPSADAARGRGGRARRLPRARSMARDGVITTRRRLEPAIFDLPVEKMRAGWYTDAYFNHTRATLLRDGRHPQRRACRCSRRRTPSSAAWTRRSRSSSSARTTGTRSTVHALYDGDRIDAVRAGADDRRRLHDVRASRDARTSARSRGAR